MSKHLALLALVAGCATPTTPTVTREQGEGPTVTVGTVSVPSPVQIPRVRRTPTASRSRQSLRIPAETGSHTLESTSYCETGLMANGQHTYRGAVANNTYRLGTRLHVSDSPYGPGIFTVADHIGWGSQLDFATPGDCSLAREWGRRDVRVEVLP